MRYLRGLFASALGSGTGTILALSLGILWPLGAILGGLLGYLAYDFGAVRAASSRAWRRMLDTRFDMTPFKTRLRVCFSYSVGIAAVLQSVMWVTLLLVYACTGFSKPIAAVLVLFLLLVPFWASSIVFAFSFIENHSPYDRYYHHDPESEIYDNWKTARTCNIVMMHYWAVVGMMKLVRWLAPRIVPAIDGLARIVLWVFHDVYSDVRLIAGGSAFSGALTGYRHASIVEGVACAVVVFTLQYMLIHLPLRHFNTARS
jgi:hypothetical protein